MAAELVGGALLSAFLQAAFDRLASPDTLNFFRKRRLNETLLNKLNVMLLSINTVVDDAEQKQISNPNVKAWLDNVKDAVFDAEDVLDDIDYEATKRKVEAESQTTATTTSKVRTFFCASVSSFEKEIETRMKKVLENLEYLATQKDVLKLEEGRGGAVIMRTGRFCHRLEVDGENTLSKMTRHVSYSRDSYETSQRFKVIYQANRLRTFLPLSMQDSRLTSDRQYARWMSSNMIGDLLSKFKCLRVLSLSDYRFIDELPESIANLKHLRFLDLSGTYVKTLPDKICELFLLQTLKLWKCSYLERLPMDLHRLINLRHLDFRGTQVREMPKKLEKLKNLQVLSPFIVGKCKETSIKQLKELNLRGTVSILGLQNVVNPGDALGANLTSKIHIEELHLEWSMDRDKPQNDKDVLEKLEPNKNLKKLQISNYGGIEFPYWFADSSLSNIVSLELSNCNYCLSLPSLGLLPWLEFLRFEGMEEWEEWKCGNASGANFPRLRELSVVRCPKLKEHLPAQLPSLRKLVIDNCEQLQASALIPSTLKVLHIGGQLPEVFSVEKIENTLANTCLIELNICDCAHLELPLRYFHNFLLKIKIERSCDSLKSFPLDLFPKLQYLRLSECVNLEMVSVSEDHHHSLTSLLIWNCPKFVSFPEGGFLAPKLEYFHIINLESLKSLPERMHILFPSLRFLKIINCPQVEPFPEGGLPSNLRTIIMWQCPKLTASLKEWGLHRYASLQVFSIGDADVDSLPNEGLLPPNLTSLDFRACSNLTLLEHKGLCHLSALESLSLRDCPKLQDLPKEGLPSSLSTLQIAGCPLLKKRFQKKKGKDWEKKLAQSAVLKETCKFGAATTPKSKAEQTTL
ncbi:putative disease resistance RPP13-like protein 1 [Senna tora]|uniref:Putative disease resistance RPP13-like protein 1 n=1 Tax=Senna tora TaxID=362788 RepID=A0A834WPI1_9FABA|nr:putative disease resistance RPP13-like protein 1 [Senna tora]